jgi:hypothetical protein
MPNIRENGGSRKRFMKTYIHSVPGRLRIRISHAKDNPGLGAEIRNILQSREAITRVAFNATTGSIVVHYRKRETTSEAILADLETGGYLNPGSTAMEEPVARRAMDRAGQALGKAVCGWAVGRALEGTGLSFLAAFI